MKLRTRANGNMPDERDLTPGGGTFTPESSAVSWNAGLIQSFTLDHGKLVQVTLSDDLNRLPDSWIAPSSSGVDRIRKALRRAETQSDWKVPAEKAHYAQGLAALG